MKIGVVFSAFNTEKYIDECLSSWIKLRDRFNITISCTSNMYRDYLNYNIHPDNFGTLRKLINYDLDYLMTSNRNIYFDENESKNTSLNLLKNKCDIIWILDADEIYTENDIINIIDYVEKHPESDWFSINFKNYTLTDKLWMDGFHPPRIFRNHRYGGINKFYFDNHIEYNNGEKFETKSNMEIPRNVAWVNHYSWLSDDSRSKHKITYQNVRFAGDEGLRCGFSWDGELKFNEKYYSSRGLPLPILHETIGEVSNEFTITFDRNKNTFFVENIQSVGGYQFKIFNGSTDELIYQTHLNVSPGSYYYMYPSNIKYHDSQEFKKYRIESQVNGKVIHNEYMHVNF
jgi:hypothetical protein